MLTEDLVLDQRCQGQGVEGVGEGFPQRRTSICANALVEKPINLRHLSGLVIPTDQAHSLAVSGGRIVSRDSHGSGTLARGIWGEDRVVCFRDCHGSGTLARGIWGEDRVAIKVVSASIVGATSTNPTRTASRAIDGL